MGNKIRYGIVGIGGVAGKAHLAAIDQLAREGAAELVGIAEAFQDRNYAELLARGKAGVDIFSSYDAMAAELELDALVISVPHDLHVPIGVDALRRNVHVLTEKPPAVDVDNGGKFVHVMRETGNVVVPNYQYTASECAHELKALIHGGEIGSISAIRVVAKQMRTNDYYGRNDWAGQFKREGRFLCDGVMLNQAPHALNQALWFLAQNGELPQIGLVRADLYKGHPADVMETEDTASIKTTINGIPFIAHMTTCYETDEPLEVVFVGTKGTATWKFNSYEIEYNDDREDVSREFPDETFEKMVLEMHGNFLAQIRDRQVKPYCSLEQGLLITRLADAAYMSSGGVLQIPDAYVTPKAADEDAARSASSTGTEGTSIIINRIGSVIAEGSTGDKLFCELQQIPWANIEPELIDAMQIEALDPRVLRPYE